MGTGSTGGGETLEPERNRDSIAQIIMGDPSAGNQQEDFVRVLVLRPYARGAARCSLAIFLAEIACQVGLKLSVIGVNGCTEGGFGGISLADSLQDALDITHAISVVNVRNGG